MRRYKVTFYSHCGMSYDLEDELMDREEAQALVKHFNEKARKKGMVVSKVAHKKNVWEHQAADEGGMVGDDEGQLAVRRVPSVRRRSWR